MLHKYGRCTRQQEKPGSTNIAIIPLALVEYLVNKPLWAAGILEDNGRG